MKNYTITVNGNVYDVVVEEGASTGAPVAAKAPIAPKAAPKAPAAAPKAGGAAGSIKVEAGAAGKIFKIEAKVGQAVKKGCRCFFILLLFDQFINLRFLGTDLFQQRFCSSFFV